MPIPEAPWHNLSPKPLEFVEQVGVLLQDIEAVPPLIAVEVVPQVIPGLQGTPAAGKGAGAMRCALRKTDV